MLTLTPTPSKISDYIYLASSSACKDEKLLNELEIKDILVIGNSVQIHFPDVNNLRSLLNLIEVRVLLTKEFQLKTKIALIYLFISMKYISI